MRYPASEKLEIIRLVEQSHLPTKRTIDRLGIPRTTFYRWYDKYLIGGVEALEDRSPKPLRVWKRIPDNVRQRIVDMALDEPELSPRELAVRFTDTQRYFVSEASVYRLLKAHDLITSSAYSWFVPLAPPYSSLTVIENPTRGLPLQDQGTGLKFVNSTRAASICLPFFVLLKRTVLVLRS